MMLKKLNILLNKQRSYYWKPKRILKKLFLNSKLEAQEVILEKHKEAAKENKN